MSEWPTGWTRRDDGGDSGYGQGAPGGGNSPGAAGTAGMNDPTVRMPYGTPAGSAAAAGDGFGTATRAAPSPWPDQPPSRAAPGPRGPGRPRGDWAGGGEGRGCAWCWPSWPAWSCCC